MSITGKDIGGFFRKFPFAAPCAVLSVALVVFIVLRGGTADDARAKLEEVGKQGERIQENISRAVLLTEQIAAIKAANAQIDAHAILPSELAQNHQYFYRLESETGVKLVDLRQQGVAAPPAKGPKPIYSKVPFSVAVQGSYLQVMDFLRRLEQGPHFTRVRSAVLNPAGGGAASAYTLSLSIELLGKS